MPCHPALALLVGSAMAMGADWIRRGTRVLCAIEFPAVFTLLGIFVAVRHLPTPGDISSALRHQPGAYKLSLGHMLDLTFSSFACRRVPLVVASVALLVGAMGTVRWKGQCAFLTTALMMPPFLQHGIWLLRCRSSANDAQLKNLWLQLERCYAVAAESVFSRFDKLLGATNIQTVVASGGRILMTNEPLGGPNLQGRRKYRGGQFIHLYNPVCMFERLN